MMTKNEFATHIVLEHIKQEHEHASKITGEPPLTFEQLWTKYNNLSMLSQSDIENYVLGSSMLGLALQQLGFVTDPEMISYLEGRAGNFIFDMYPHGQMVSLTIREMFDLLPTE